MEAGVLTTSLELWQICGWDPSDKPDQILYVTLCEGSGIFTYMDSPGIAGISIYADDLEVVDFGEKEFRQLGEFHKAVNREMIGR